jgi:alanine racemase
MSAGGIECKLDGQIAEIQSSSSWIVVDIDAVEHNLAEIRRVAPHSMVMAVVKANAYGHGLQPMGRFLQELGVEWLAVAKFEEALDLREWGVTCDLLNMGPIYEPQVKKLLREDVVQSIFSIRDARLLNSAALSSGNRARVHVKIDTGLGRVGVRYDLAEAFVRELCQMPGLKIEGIFTTFTEEEDFDRIQLERLMWIHDSLKSKGIRIPLRHAASSAAILSLPESHMEIVRPGIMIYGYYPSRKERLDRKVDLRPAMSLKGRVEHVKEIESGDSLYYHRAFIAPGRMRVATIHVGYSDGYPKALSKNGVILKNGRRYHILGGVSANHFMIDLEDDSDTVAGDEITLIGRSGGDEISVEEAAELANVSEYDVILGMSPLLPRVYLRKGRVAEIFKPVLKQRSEN